MQHLRHQLSKVLDWGLLAIAPYPRNQACRLNWTESESRRSSEIRSIWT